MNILIRVDSSITIGTGHRMRCLTLVDALKEQAHNIHYVPVPLHPYYKQKFGYQKGLCPIAENAYNNIISLPLWPGMEENEILHIKNCFQ